MKVDSVSMFKVNLLRLYNNAVVSSLWVATPLGSP